MVQLQWTNIRGDWRQIYHIVSIHQSFLRRSELKTRSVFSVGCDGSVTAGIIGGEAFIFSVVNNNAVVTNLGAGSSKAKRDIPVPPGYYVLPTAPPPSAKGSRCAGADQTAVSKMPSPPQKSNGCGSDTFPSKYTPNLWFLKCCNDHDLCFSKTDLSCHLTSFSFELLWRS
jgi:hypothetical protein